MARTATTQPATTEPEQPPHTLAPLTAEAVAAQTDAGSFKRGQGYFRSSRIFNAVRRGNTLRARCHGSSGGPYVVEATLAEAGKAKARNPVTFICDCPRGGFCKHIVALLLTWIERPESFAVRPPLAEVLAAKSQEELIALIELMLREVPDLEELVELPVPAAGVVGEEEIEEAAIRRQIADAMRDEEGYGGYHRYDRYDRRYYDYDEYWPGARIAAKLERLAALADAYVDAGHWQNALSMSATLVEEMTPHLASVSDHDGDLYGILGRADENLAACLDAQAELAAEKQFSTAERTRLIDAIMTIWQTDLDIGGVSMSQEGPEAIARVASPEEQRRVADQVRGAMRPTPGHDWNRTWRNQEAIGFLSLLSGDAGLSDDELLAEYQNAELWPDAAEMLLQLDRVDEAIALAARRLAPAMVLTAFADRLMATGDPKHIERAITLVDDRLWEQEGKTARDDEALRQWLERQYAAHGRPEKSLELALARFKNLPSRTTYDAVKAAALLPGQPDDPWPALRKNMLATLRKREDWYGLIDIQLGEGDVAEAIEALKQSEKRGRTFQSGWGYGWTAPSAGHESRVAAAAEADFPGESIRIYRTLSDQLIAARGRANYQVAAEYLRRAMNVLERHGRAEEWTALITDVRQSNKSLRALKEELDSLGLV